MLNQVQVLLQKSGKCGYGSLLIFANVDSQVAIAKLAASQPALKLTFPERFQQKATKTNEMCPSVLPRTKVVKNS